MTITPDNGARPVALDWRSQPARARSVDRKLRAEEPEELIASRHALCLARALAMPATKKRALLHPDLAEVLLTDEQIRQRIKTLAQEIKGVYGEREFTIISLINGAVMFTADLMREIDNPVRLDCIRVSSYGVKTKSIGAPQVIYSLTLDIARRDVLIIDDILDTGKTLKLVRDLVSELKPASVRTCVLLDKKARREVNMEADFVGFEIPDKFVVGYGLDFAERYRNLPGIGVLKPEKQVPPVWTAG